LEAFKGTGLWRKTLGDESAWDTDDSLSVLRANYAVFRERSAALTAQIAKAIPNLTIHDVTHLDALWETADLIAGAGYPLNPAEAFVFGGAVLTHDAALCFEAYEGGQRGLRETVEWRDAFAAIQAKNPLQENQEKLDEADFTAMRMLHASRATELANISWKTPEGEDLYLIENHGLRKHYGQLIGNIAASHHWPIEDVKSKLPNQVNALGSMPRDWRVDPVKVACLLRCADAAHVDSRRAPDFLRALAILHGVSAHHWTAQNWLERVDADAADPDQSSLIFTSGKSFDEANADAWWVTFDAVRLVDKELKACADLLENRPQSRTSPPFQMRRVTGASSPAIASKSIIADGWQPQAVEIHVSNLERLISQLGGNKLYGEEQTFVVVLRELIQNARDSILARRSFDKEYLGRIRVIVSDEKTENIVYVEDDGIGMSYRVITGPLLDFGSSFWASDLVRNEFPGLLSGGYKPVGKFGIGFYSVFMAASAVSIASRRFDEGVDRVTQVRFPRGLSLRPLISTGPPSGFGFANSTVVKATIKEEFGTPSNILISKGRPGYDPAVVIPIRQCLSILCAGLDVSVELKVHDSEFEVIHLPLQELDSDEKRKNWLFGILGAVEDENVRAVLLECAGRIRPISDNGEILGMAALSTSLINNNRMLGTIATVGGLATTISQSNLSRFVGVIDYQPNSAKREPSPEPSAGRAALERWASEQKALLPPRETNLVAWCIATCSLADLQCDPIEIATFLIRDGESILAFSLDQIIDLIKTRGLAIYQSHMMDHVETHHNQGSFRNFPTFLPIANSAFISLSRDEKGEPPITSLLSCIFRRARERALVIEENFLPNISQSYFGPMSVLLLRHKVIPPIVNVNVAFDS
jgi:hypothetical protein